MFDPNKLLNQMLGADGAKQAQGAMGQVGGLLGNLLKDSVAGMQQGAADIEKSTGIGAKADGMLKNATGGKSAGDLLKQAQEFAANNKLAFQIKGRSSNRSAPRKESSLAIAWSRSGIIWINSSYAGS